MAVLELIDFGVMRGLTPVVSAIKESLHAGEVVALVGRNGSGKSTLLEGIAGLHPSMGSLRCGDRLLGAMPADDRVRAGISLCPEGRTLFADLTVWENLLLGAYLERSAVAEQRAQALASRFPLLAAERTRRAGQLSGGEQQVVALCRALMSQPRVLLLDQPTMGLAPGPRAAVTEVIGEYLQGERAVLIADDNLEFLLGVTTRVVALSGGQVVFRIADVRGTGVADVMRMILEAEAAPGVPTTAECSR